LQLSGHARPLVHRAGRPNPFCEISRTTPTSSTLIVAYLRAKKLAFEFSAYSVQGVDVAGCLKTLQGNLV